MGFDLLLIVIMLVSMAMGVMRGFFRELLSIVGWLLVRAEAGEVAMLALGGVIGLGLWGLAIYSILRKPTDKDE